MESVRVTGERSFDDWVCRRLADWPTTQILDFERWLEDNRVVEFMPALYEVLRRRWIELEAPDVVDESAA